MSRASNLAGFTTAVGPPTDLNVGVVTAISISAQTITSTDTYTFSNLDISESISVGSSVVGVTTINSSGINSPLGIGTFNKVAIGTDNSNRSLVVYKPTSDAIAALVASQSEQAIVLFGDSDDDAIGQIRYDNNDDSMAFRVNTSERLRITSGGELQIANGNLKFSTAGTGIDFSATSNSAGTTTSELLDDYEEGTFTPQLEFNTPGNASFTYSEQIGYYTKVGNLVTCRLECRLTSFAKGTASGNLNIINLPYTVATQGSAGQFLGNIAFFSAPTPTAAGSYPVIVALLNTTLCSIRVVGNNSLWTEIPDPDGNSQYKAQITYMVP